MQECLTGEHLILIAKGLELQGVAGRVEEEHGGLLTWLVGKPGVGLDDKVCSGSLQFVGKGSPGVALAVLSGTVASGLGYVIWYSALHHLTTTVAAVVQLAVPVIAAGGGVLLMSEVLTLRLASASVLILGGIWLTITAHSKAKN